jgi:predicted PurR-regulated permease PerM
VLFRSIRELFQADGLRNLAEAGLKRLLPGLWSVLSGAVSLLLGLLGLLVVGLYLVFLLLDLPSVSATWPRLIPARHREKVLAYTAEANLAMSRYFRAQAFIAAIVGAIYALGFTVLGLPLGVLLGLLMAVLNMVPYLEIVGLLPACLLAGVQALETGTSFWLAVGKVGLVFAVSQAAQGLVLTPRIMGQATGLSPALILLSLSVWGKLLGFLGLIIALPLTCLVWAWYQRLFCNPPEGVE